MAVLPGPFYCVYVDDSGNGTEGWLWLALAIPAAEWVEYLRRWLSFRKWLRINHGVPASFEIHSGEWLSPNPLRLVQVAQADSLRGVRVLQVGRAARRERGVIFEKALKTIGTMTEARIITVYTTDRFEKIALYDHLLCALEECFESESGRGSLLVDGGIDGGHHLRGAHRALKLKLRRVIEDPAMRRSHESQLLQMADICAFTAFQSILKNPNRDERFHRMYQEVLGRLVAAVPWATSDDDRCIRGLDYDVPPHDCVSERMNAGRTD